MVKFGRHIEFYAAHQQQLIVAASESHDDDDKQDQSNTIQQQQQQQLSPTAAAGVSQATHSNNAQQLLSTQQPATLVIETSEPKLYVVPYNEIKTKCIPTYAARDKSPVSVMTKFNEDGDEKNRKPTDKLESKNQERNTSTTTATSSGVNNNSSERLRLRALSLSNLAASLTPNDIFFTIQKFKTDWRQCLVNASRDFEFQLQQFWRQVFDGLEDAALDNKNTASGSKKTIDPDDIRGALPDTALRLYLQMVATPQQTQSLYTTLKNIHSTSLINSEALRKLVKKFDKEMSKLIKQGIHCDDGSMIGPAHTTPAGTNTLRLSSKLLPEVYRANFNVGLPTVEASLALARQHLERNEKNNDHDYDDEDDEEYDDMHLSEVQAARIKFLAMGAVDEDDMKENADEDVAGFFGLTLHRVAKAKRDIDAELVEKRISELRWLRKLVESIKEADRGNNIVDDNSSNAVSTIGCLVGHRGFHSIKDKTNRRPLENSLVAYEAAWTNGIELCECDIALTKDDKLILAHDENFVRLALDPTDPLVHRKVSDLTHKEIMSLPLKSGVRPPLLFDVLRSAAAIAGEARMIVEIKPGNIEAGTALAKLFAQFPHLMERCAVVMSFDAFAMQNLRRELEIVFPSLPPPPPKDASITSAGAAIAATSGPSTMMMSKPNGPKKHRRGVSLGPMAIPSQHGLKRHHSFGGAPLIDNIPTAMSIGGGGGGVLDHGPIHRAGPTADVHGSMGPGSSLISPAQTPRPTAVAATTTTTHHKQPRVLATIPAGVKIHDLPPHPRGATAATTVVIPKLLLITRNGPAQNEEQKDALQVDVSNKSDMERVVSWLHGGAPSDRLDGLYMQYQPHMLTEEGMKQMRPLTGNYSVGIWGANPNPDDYETFKRLVQDCGVKYVNTGLPKKFFRNNNNTKGKNNNKGNPPMMRSGSTGNLSEMNYNNDSNNTTMRRGSHSGYS